MMKVIVAALAILITIISASSTLAAHRDDVCELTAIQPSQVQTLLVKGALGGPLSSSVTEGQLLEVQVILELDTTVTSSEDLALEVGMYPKNSLQDQSGFLTTTFVQDFIVNPAVNCVEDEDFVQSIHVSPDGSQPLLIEEFALLAPVDASLNNGGSREYVVQAILFKNCYRKCFNSTGSQILAVGFEFITLENSPVLEAEESSDGVQNGGETDIDCGGSSDNACGPGFGCIVNDDCEDGLLCQQPNAEFAPHCSVVNPPGQKSSTSTKMIVVALMLIGGFLLLQNNKKTRR